jgi:glutamyl-tRNA reductase
MLIYAIGLSHKTAPLAVRERAAFAPERVADALRELVSLAGVKEAAILSTCNRAEVYCALGSTDDGHKVSQWFEQYHGHEPGALGGYFYTHHGERAVKHILRVASGLDSMILGEPQILGQLKAAYALARSNGTMGGVLDRLFRDAFKTAKRVRTQTGIGTGSVSVASAAGGLAVQEFCQRSPRAVLFIGAGQTVELVARHLADKTSTQIVIANRSLENAQRLARLLNGEACKLPQITDHLPDVDVIVSCTASPQPIIRAEQIEDSMRRRGNRPLVIVDLAVPRDVDPSVEEIEGVCLYTIDDLRCVTEQNWRFRAAAADHADAVIKQSTRQFMARLGVLDVVPVIRQYRDRAQEKREETLNRARKMLAQGVSTEDALTFLANTLTNKLLHPSTVALRKAGMLGDSEMIAAAEILLGLTEEQLEKNASNSDAFGIVRSLKRSG